MPAAITIGSRTRSRKTRYFYPSCHQKRVLLYGDCVEKNVLIPIPHGPSRYVFAATQASMHSISSDTGKASMSRGEKPLEARST